MLLTLAMSVVLMILVSQAMNFYVREMGSAEAQFRQSQVATAVLQMIEDDLRMTIVARPVDTSGLDAVLASAASPLEQLGLSGDMVTGDEVGQSSTDSGSVTGDSDEILADDSSTLDAALGGTVLVTPGLIGNISQIQIDVSRLPSLEQTMLDPDLAATAGMLSDRPSDIKTVSYFVQAEGMPGGNDPLAKLAASLDGADVATTAGLVRRQIDRAIFNEASLSGGESRLSDAGQRLASEVTAIEFEYFDGINWLPQYSSDETGYLPLAIRVTLQLSTPTTLDQTDAIDDLTQTYTHVIHLPMSFPEDGEEEETVEDETIE